MADRSRGRVALGVERLEDRQLLASHIAFNPLTGVVTVNGTPHNDRVVVSYARGDRVRVALTGGASGVAVLPSSQVTEIVFNGRGGHDTLRNQTAIPAILIAPPKARARRGNRSGLSGGNA